MAKRGQGEGTISKRPDGTWWARITVGRDTDGKQKRKAFYGKTRKEVQEKLTAAISEINKGTYIEPSKITVGQWMSIWTNEYQSRSIRPSTLIRNRSVANKYIIPKLGNYLVKDLRVDMVQKFINQLTNDGESPQQVERAYVLLKNACEQAVLNDMIPKNPVRGAIKPKYEKSEARVLTVEEQDKIIRAAPLYACGHIFILMLFTGLRIGEAVALTWSDIDFENKILRVNKTQSRYKMQGDDIIYSLGVSQPKTKSSTRSIPLISKIVEMLEHLKNENETKKLLNGADYNPNNFVFCSRTGRMCGTPNMRNTLHRLTSKLGIEGVHPHTLRHTFATRGAEQGIDLKVMQTLLGHSEINTTANIYTHVLEEQKAMNISKLESLL